MFALMDVTSVSVAPPASGTRHKEPFSGISSVAKYAYVSSSATPSSVTGSSARFTGVPPTRSADHMIRWHLLVGRRHQRALVDAHPETLARLAKTVLGSFLERSSDMICCAALSCQ